MVQKLLDQHKSPCPLSLQPNLLNFSNSKAVLALHHHLYQLYPHPHSSSSPHHLLCQSQNLVFDEFGIQSGSSEMKVHCCNSEMFKAVIFYTYPIMKPPIRGGIFAQKYLRKCKDTYFILQNKYIRIYEDSFGGFGAKILRDDCPPNPHHLT